MQTETRLKILYGTLTFTIFIYYDSPEDILHIYYLVTF